MLVLVLVLELELELVQTLAMLWQRRLILRQRWCACIAIRSDSTPSLPSAKRKSKYGAMPSMPHGTMPDNVCVRVCVCAICVQCGNHV